ncbi:hypothetical protein CR492_11870 [Methylocella silvestris]|uniref:Uncharacterized protein n=1 Tax=Methylocella silvestris TaxID=199596 RepID=A0A2J7TGB1_METSI|nr:hypothetical protein CR492_11870 [Methylocella silvestris]
MRQSVSLALRENFEDAYGILDEAKIISPDYFEIFRIEAFVAFRQGDNPRAANAYETAFEYGINQPQLHHFYGGFLIRSFGDYPAASKQFDIALESDPLAVPVLREAARNKFFLYDFGSAQGLLSKAYGVGFLSHKDGVLVSDLQAQLYYRQAEFLLRSGDPRGAFESLRGLQAFVSGLSQEYFDATLVEHLQKALPVIESMQRYEQFCDLEMLDTLELTIRKLHPAFAVSALNEKCARDIYPRRVGLMKVQGRKETFGFLRDEEGVDAFIARASVDESLWAEMCNGKYVEYSIDEHADGKAKATNARLWEFKLGKA